MSISYSSGETKRRINDTEKEIYIIILWPNKNKIKINDLKILSKLSAKIIYNKRIEKGKDLFLEQTVFKLITKRKDSDIDKEKNKNNYCKYRLKYEVGEDLYEILFFVGENTFVYKPKLEKGNKLIDNIVKLNIDQNVISFSNKLDIFLEALKINNENDKIEKSYKETINLYKINHKFDLLISLFVKIYEQNKRLCSTLIGIFKKINESENSDKDKELISQLDIFNKIYSKAENIIKNNGYEAIDFYGILLCYLSFYDKDNFPQIIKKLYEVKSNVLYEILIIYSSHFVIPLNQVSDFYNNFVKYAIKQGKEFNILERILDYIDDIETILYVINDNKAEIYKKYDLRFKHFELHNNLRLTKKEYKEKNINQEKNVKDNMIKLVEEIIEFSFDKQILIIYLKDSFWYNLLNQYNYPDLEYIDKCYQIRILSKKYYKLTNILFNKCTNENELSIMHNIKRYNDRDPFAFILDKNIKVLLEQGIYSDEQKLGILVKYNPYYNIENIDDYIKYKIGEKLIFLTM